MHYLNYEDRLEWRLMKLRQSQNTTRTFSVTLEFHLRTIASALKSFHVMKLWNVSPVSRSHVMNVLRCDEMPIHETSFAINRALQIASRIVFKTADHNASGLISQ